MAWLAFPSDDVNASSCLYLAITRQIATGCCLSVQIGLAISKYPNKMSRHSQNCPVINRLSCVHMIENSQQAPVVKPTLASIDICSQAKSPDNGYTTFNHLLVVLATASYVWPLIDSAMRTTVTVFPNRGLPARYVQSRTV